MFLFLNVLTTQPSSMSHITRKSQLLLCLNDPFYSSIYFLSLLTNLPYPVTCLLCFSWTYFISHSFQIVDKVIKKLLFCVRINTLAIQYLDSFLLVPLQQLCTLISPSSSLKLIQHQRQPYYRIHDFEVVFMFLSLATQVLTDTFFFFSLFKQRLSHIIFY